MKKLIVLISLLVSFAFADSQLVSLLSVSWHNAFCEMHKNRKECRAMSNYASNHFVLHGLWPDNRDYCKIPHDLIEKDKKRHWRALPKIDYPNSLKKDMLKYMPGVLSALDRHEWVKHGSCYADNPIKYFSDAISLVKSVDNSMVGEYFRANIGGKINIVNLRRVFDRAFGKGSGKRVIMKCRDGLITEIRIKVAGRGDNLKEMIKNAPTFHSRTCSEGIVDRP